MESIAKTLIMAGVLFVVAGIVILLFAKIPGMGKLPGDIIVKRENFTFYFPVATCLLISLMLSFIFYLFNHK